MTHKLSRLFFDNAGRWRNGWWALLFLAAVAATAVIYKPVMDLLKSTGVDRMWLEPVAVGSALLATWICTRLRRERLSSVGLAMDGRWWRQWGVGLVLGMATMFTAAGLIWLVGGVRFQFDPAFAPLDMMRGLYVFAFAALLEELLFRGFLFQRMVEGLGAWPTQIALAALFALSHGANPGMEGTTAIWASIDIALAAVMLGLAWLRTRSLALPFGLHLGWNWAQGNLLGFGVSGYDHTGWLMPVFQGRPQWLTGGEFGPEASVFGVVVDLAMIFVLWRWKGTARERVPVPPVAPAQLPAV